LLKNRDKRPFLINTHKFIAILDMLLKNIG
jgi:hypothetical protein